MSYHWDFSILWQYHAVLLEGILTTFKIVLASVTLSILGGALLAPLRGASRAVIRLPTQGLIEIVRSIPPSGADCLGLLLSAHFVRPDPLLVSDLCPRHLVIWQRIFR